LSVGITRELVIPGVVDEYLLSTSDYSILWS